MPIISFAVIQAESEWRLLSARRMMGHFKSRAEAIKAGQGLAREASSSGYEVEFLVQSEAGELQRSWE